MPQQRRKSWCLTSLQSEEQERAQEPGACEPIGSAPDGFKSPQPHEVDGGRDETEGFNGGGAPEEAMARTETKGISRLKREIVYYHEIRIDPLSGSSLR